MVIPKKLSILSEWNDDYLTDELRAQAQRQMEIFRLAHKTKVLTIFFSDIVGSTQLQDKLGNDRAVSLLESHRIIFRETLKGFDGLEVETAGDSFLAVFASPSEGIWFALKIQANMRHAREKEPDFPALRIGLHQGQVIEQHKDNDNLKAIYGIQVSIASRIMSLGCGGQILCSRTVFDDASAFLRNKSIEGLGELDWRIHGSYQLKNVRNHQEIGEVGEKKHAPFVRPVGRIVRRIPIILGVVASGSAILTLVWVLFGGYVIVFNDVRPDVKNIVENTEIVRQNTSDIQGSLNELKKTTGSQNESTVKIAETIKENMEAFKDYSENTSIALQEVANAFESLKRGDSLIQNPKEAHEYYYNAQIYQMKGDFLNARESFEKFFDFKLDFIDPHIEYIKLLKSQEGHEGARSIYRQKITEWNTQSACLAEILLYDHKNRIEPMLMFTKNNPKYAPVYYLLSKEYSKDTLGDQTIEELRNEKKFLDLFIASLGSGSFYGYFINKNIAEEWKSEAEERILAFDNRFEQESPSLSEVIENPVKVNFYFNAANTWLITIDVEEEVSAVEYKWENCQEYLPYEIGRMIVENLDSSERQFFVKYWDLSNREQGPYSFTFNPTFVQLSSTVKDFNDDLAFGFPVSIVKEDSEMYCDISRLFKKEENYRQGGPKIISEIHYSFDSDNLDLVAYRIDNNENYLYPTRIKIPSGAKYIMLQITYGNNEKSIIWREKFSNQNTK